MNNKENESENSYKKLTREEVIELYKEASNKGLVKEYEKFVKVLARPAKKSEKITTSIEGEKRTKNQAKSGDFVVKNPSGEEYIVSGKKFKQRYTQIGEAEDFPNYKRYEAVGIVWGFQYHGPDLKIEAPWGEEQIVKDGDMLVSTGKESYDDIYSIQIDIFKDTYRGK